jgi:hypothetical protein
MVVNCYYWSLDTDILILKILWVLIQYHSILEQTKKFELSITYFQVDNFN